MDRSCFAIYAELNLRPVQPAQLAIPGKEPERASGWSHGDGQLFSGQSLTPAYQWKSR